MSRTVTLVLVDAAGAPLGALPPYEVPLPWWQEVSDVVAGARQRYGLDVAVLRLLDADRPAPTGGAVTYLAQVDAAPATALTRAEVDLARHPLRAPWAEPGAPAAAVTWATGELRRLGRPAGRVAQQRTWNLSAIWRVDAPATRHPADEGRARDEHPGRGAWPPVAWLKQVPPFFAHEAMVLRWLATAVPGAAPTLLACGAHGRMLLAHVPGEDWYDADSAGRHRIAEALHRIQRRSVPEVDALVAAGLPDRRSGRLLDALRHVVARHGNGVPGLSALVDTLPERIAEIAACGLPDVLAHGDAHPGNTRTAQAGPAGAGGGAATGAGGPAPVILDWGDCFAGNPAFDLVRLIEDVPAEDAGALLAAWARRWRRDAPGSDPARAVALSRPVAALRNAAMYADFVASIEPSERRFHAADVPAWLERAARAAGG